MKPMVVTYHLPSSGLSIHLRDLGGMPPHERLRDLHQAANRWAAERGVQLRSDLSSEPAPGLPAVELTEYLYGDGAMNEQRLGRHLGMLLDPGEIHRFTLRAGSPVEGQDLIGRHATSNELQQALSAGTSCHLAAPRRYGKTSLLRHIQRTQGRPTVFVDLSPGDSDLWFLIAVARAAMDCRECRERLIKLPELAAWPVGAAPMERAAAGHALGDRIRPNPSSFGRRMLEALREVEAILLLDEFSVFLRAAIQHRANDAHALTRLLAEFRTGHPRLVQVFSGSEGLNSYIRFHDMGDQFGDLKTIQLPPLGTDDGLVLAEELCYGALRRPTRQAVQAILDEVGEPVPYFIHVLVDAIYAALPSAGPVTSEVVREAYADRVLGPMGNHLFRTYVLGSQPYPEKLRRAASMVLRAIVEHPEGCKEADLLARAATTPEDFRSLLSCLQEDYDLVEHDGCWRMRSKVLRERWALAEAWLTTAA